MDRLACVEVRELPLQVLLHAHDDWAESPVAVVESDKPTSLVTHANEAARQAGVLPGLRYGEALSLCAKLHAAPVSAADIERAMQEFVALLRLWSPAVEVQGSVFWCDVSGLSQLFPSLIEWSAQVHAALQAAEWSVSVCVGFSRFGTSAIARALPLGQVRCLLSVSEERTWVARVPLRRLGLPADSLMPLEKLGVATVGALLRLPVSGLRKRFGEDVERIAMLASGRRVEPFQPVAEVLPVISHLDFDEPILDVNQLLFACLEPLRRLMDTLENRQLSLKSLTLTLGFDRPKGEVNVPRDFSLAFAEPTLDQTRVSEQLRLTLQSAWTVEQSLGVKWLELEVRGAAQHAAQLALVDRPRRSVDAIRRSLERVRAAFGDDSVVTLTHGAGHLPEARLRFEPLDDVPPMPERIEGELQLIRRVELKPSPCAAPVEQGVSVMLNGGWWRGEVRREYRFVEEHGVIRWLYFDVLRGRWMRHGSVE